MNRVVHIRRRAPLNIPRRNFGQNGSPLENGELKNSGPPPSEPAKADVTIHRAAAFGDVIMASAIASRLHEQGVSVRFSCVPEVQPALFRHPHIKEVCFSERPEVNLDGSYENHPSRKFARTTHLMADSAREQLAKIGIPFVGNHNLTPTLRVTAGEVESAERLLASHPRPFVVFSPTSNAWPNRSVTRDVWEKVECVGTKLWIGTSAAPQGFVDLRIRKWRDLVGVMSLADLCVSVDTGPLHVAAGLGVPTVAIEQSQSIGLRVLGDQTDWSSVGSSLDCIGCGEMTCPIDKDNPPCAKPDPDRISAAIESKLGAVLGNRISAVIPVYRPHQRLLRCIEAVKDQVDEIVISLDGNANLDGFLPDNPKIVVVQNPTGKRTGFGHTMGRAMRRSTGRFLLLLNDDAYADPGSVLILRRAMEPGVAVVGALTRYPNGRIYHGGTDRNRIGFRHIDHNLPVAAATIRIRTEMEFSNLAFAMVIREAYFDVHGFDQRYDCYSEDADFCMSVRKVGWKVMYDPAATAIHDEGQSTTSAEKFDLLREGNTKFLGKWWRYFQRNANNQLGTFT